MKTKKIVVSSMLAALVCVLTFAIRIPLPTGYVNPGDVAVILCGYFLPPVLAFVSAGIGSLFADVFSGYVLYAPATFIIKGIMAVLAYWGLAKSKKKHAKFAGIFFAEAFMVVGYYVFEGFVYGFYPSCANIIPNCVQGLFGFAASILIIKLLVKNKIFTKNNPRL